MANAFDLQLGHIEYECPWLRVESFQNPQDPDGAPFYRVVEQPGIICITLCSDGTMPLVKQFRPAIGHETIEFPAGAIDEGETAIEAAQREVLEEVGATLTHLYLIGSANAVPNRFLNPQTLFLGIGNYTPDFTPHDPSVVRQIIKRDQFLEVLQKFGMDSIAAVGAMKVAELSFQIDVLKDDVGQLIKRLGPNLL